MMSRLCTVYAAMFQNAEFKKLFWTHVLGEELFQNESDAILDTGGSDFCCILCLIMASLICFRGLGTICIQLCLCRWNVRWHIKGSAHQNARPIVVLVIPQHERSIRLLRSSTLRRRHHKDKVYRP